jgi:hypothetical protein
MSVTVSIRRAARPKSDLYALGYCKPRAGRPANTFDALRE